MVKLAVAGGADGLGRAIVDAIRNDGKHEIIILSRRAHKDPAVTVVDYSSIEDLRNLFEREKIHTVVSTIGAYTEAHHRSQMNMIEAADLSPSVKRFIPSEFGFHIKPEIAHRSVSFPFKLETLKRLEKSGLEFTLIHTGVFLDYLVYPRVPSYLQCQTVWVHLGLNIAALPGDGNVPVAFTHSEDVGKLVALILDVPRWERRYYAVANRLTLNELVKIAEEVKGNPIAVKYDPREMLERGECTILPGPTESEWKDDRFDAHDQFMKYMADLGSLAVDGLADLDAETPIQTIFSGFKPLTVREAVKKWVLAG
ncbi:hypothetical protein NM208_g2943 [Fusarium decemcellulare]|uniref:Uncharacterized protein n=1 Tax=Fusarium decemcellulare TaxID=57161 RepID=A0ACC1SQW4_9HYPO|nr:hypothetical protein NM208_g2943 [Fusarium decemcellulare]